MFIQGQLRSCALREWKPNKELGNKNTRRQSTCLASLSVLQPRGVRDRLCRWRLEDPAEAYTVRLWKVRVTSRLVPARFRIPACSTLAGSLPPVAFVALSNFLAGLQSRRAQQPVACGLALPSPLLGDSMVVRMQAVTAIRLVHAQQLQAPLVPTQRAPWICPCGAVRLLAEVF